MRTHYESVSEIVKEIPGTLEQDTRGLFPLSHCIYGRDYSKWIKKYGMWLWPEDDVRAMLKEVGFSEVSITYAKGFMMPKMMIARGVK